MVSITTIDTTYAHPCYFINIKGELKAMGDGDHGATLMYDPLGLFKKYLKVSGDPDFPKIHHMPRNILSKPKFAYVIPLNDGIPTGYDSYFPSQIFSFLSYLYVETNSYMWLGSAPGCWTLTYAHIMIKFGLYHCRHIDVACWLVNEYESGAAIGPDSTWVDKKKSVTLAQIVCTADKFDEMRKRGLKLIDATYTQEHYDEYQKYLRNHSSTLDQWYQQNIHKYMENDRKSLDYTLSEFKPLKEHTQDEAERAHMVIMAFIRMHM